jgi:cobalamin-dependent methionine synthase I
MDALASAAIEALCDGIQAELAAELPEGYYLTGRFSCGYGDLPLEIQPEILAVLNTQKTIGLFCNQNNILLPRKSVTAVMGVTAVRQETDICDTCRLRQ